MRFDLSAPPLADFIAMRSAEGWGEISQETARASLSSSLINLCAYDEESLAGFGRVVGDGALYFYIQDLIVAPAYRGQRIGRSLIHNLLTEIESIAASGAMIGLMAAHGKEDFYKGFGFIARPNETYGAGMIKLV